MPTTTPLGKVSITPKGEFILGMQYHILDVVYSPQEHAAFLARKDNVNVGLEDADIWMKLAQGVNGKSAFDAAAAGGYTGTKEEFYKELADFNGYAAQAKESAYSAASSKEAAQQAAETATSKAEEMQNTLGVQPEGAGTVWENIGERPEGVTGTLWENRGGGTPGQDVVPVVTTLTLTSNNENVTITNSACFIVQTGNVITVQGQVVARFNNMPAKTYVDLTASVPSPSGVIAVTFNPLNHEDYNHYAGFIDPRSSPNLRLRISLSETYNASKQLHFACTYQLNQPFGLQVIKPDLAPITNRLTDVETKASAVDAEIGTGFSASNTIMSNIGTRPSGKTGSLWENVGNANNAVFHLTFTTDNPLASVGFSNVDAQRSGNLVLVCGELTYNTLGATEVAFTVNLPWKPAKTFVIPGWTDPGHKTTVDRAFIYFNMSGELQALVNVLGKVGNFSYFFYYTYYTNDSISTVNTLDNKELA